MDGSWDAPSESYADESEWLMKLRDVTLDHSDVSKLVMHFLVTEGFVNTARELAEETDADPGVDFETISDRMEIRQAVHAGRLQEAIKRVNELDPQILRTNEELTFRLYKQHLIELIREGQVENSLQYAQDEVGPLAKGNEVLIRELEKAVTLLAFEDPSQSPLKDLLDYSERRNTASQLNAAILANQHQESESRLPLLLRKFKWTQDKLKKKCGGPHFDFNCLGLDDLAGACTSQGQ